MASVFVITPHADDETLGMGGTVAKHSLQGDDVFVLLVAKHKDKTRHSEFQEACKILGATGLDCEDYYPDGTLDHDRQRLIGTFDKYCYEYKPDFLYLPYPSQHQDHRAVYEAGIGAARISLNSNHHHVSNILVYSESVAEIELYSTGIRWNYYVDISGQPLEKKLLAMEAHASQTLAPPHPSNKDYLMAEAIAAGGSANLNAAERFSVIRYTA